MFVRAQVVLHTVDNLSANYVTNSWCFETPTAPGASDFDDYRTAFKDFYDDLAGLIGPTIAQNGHEVKFYDLENTTPPNYPLAERVWNLASAPGGSSLPTEVAVCLSFQGQRVPGFPQARRRGRVYIGPFTTTANSSGRPSTTVMSTLASAAVTLCTNLKGAGLPGLLSVWSHVDGTGVEVTNGWIDDAFDTQRRRGIQRTTRNTWVAP